MTENITVHEFEDTIYTMDGYGRVRVFTVDEDGAVVEIKPEES